MEDENPNSKEKNPEKTGLNGKQKREVVQESEQREEQQRE